MTPNDLNVVKVKRVDVHTTYTIEGQILFYLSLRDERVLRYGPILRNCTEPKMTWSRWNVPPYLFTYTDGPTYWFVSLYDEVFLSMALILRNVTQNDL